MQRVGASGPFYLRTFIVEDPFFCDKVWLRCQVSVFISFSIPTHSTP